MTNEMVTTVMDFAETVKMVEEMKKNAEANVAFANQLKANIVALQKSTAHDLAVHNGKVLVKVERKAREGDFVVFEGLESHYTANGVFYGVYKECGELHYTAADGFSYDVYGWERRCPNPKVYEVIGNIPQSNLVVEAFEPIPIENGTKPPCKHLTANQKRARAIKMAKEFVECQKSTLSGFAINVDGGFKTYENVYSPVNRKTGIKAACNAEFVRKGNRVTCLLKGVESNQVYCVGRSECRVDDVFNERIGEAIALAKALDIVEQLPPDILKAVQPDSFVKGMKVVWVDDFGGVNERIVERVNGIKVHFTNSYWMSKDEVAVIDDTNADYSLQGGEK